MNQFKFRLESVRRLRERTRDEAAESYRQARLAISKLSIEIERLMAEHASHTPSVESLSAGNINTQRLLESQRYQMHLMQNVSQLSGQVQTIEVEAEKRRKVLVACEQALRSLDKLEERQSQAWKAEDLASKQIALDEWAGFRYWKGLGSEATGD